MNRTFTLTAIIAFVVAGFGFGAVWLGSEGLKITFYQLGTTQTASTLESSSPTPPIPTTLPASLPTFSSLLPASKTTPSPNTLSILIGGDIMLDRDVRAIGIKYGYDSLFAEVAPLFRKTDIVAANLEGPITSEPSKTLLENGRYGNDLEFTFSPTALPSLVNAGLQVVSLANNHTDNFGRNGWIETKKWLSYAGLGYFGSPSNDAGAEKVICKHDICVAFVGYHAFQPGFDRIVSDVKRLSAKGDFVIVMPHWGVEYKAAPTTDIKAKARVLVKAGADAVIGSHPHVIGEHEWIGRAPVFYSLGNLLFDQYFSPETQSGQMVELTLKKKGGAISNDKNIILESVKTYQVSNESHRGITLVGEPIEVTH